MLKWKENAAFAGIQYGSGALGRSMRNIILPGKKQRYPTLIIVNDETCKKTKMPSGKKVRSEEIFPKFVAGLGTPNKETYAIMAENSHILSGYLKKLSLVRVMLGDESCCNLLNPADFVCPMVACRGKNPTRLNSWNSLFNFHKDLITHNFDKDKVANALNERYKLLDLNGWHDSNFNYGVTEMIEMLKEKNECSLENMALYTVKEGDKFRGSDSCPNEKLMREFMAGDISALKRIKNQPTILSLARIAAVAEKDSKSRRKRVMKMKMKMKMLMTRIHL